MILRNCALFLAIAALAYTKPVQNVDLAAVNTFLTNLAASDSRTDSLVTLNYQNMASKKNPDHDNAKDPLFTSVDKSIDETATYIVIANLQPYFQLDSESPISTDPDYTNAVNSFLTNYLATDAVKQAWTFLQAQGVSTADPAAFRQQLYNLWFAPYARNQVLGSNGFKSVFIGEATGTTITRFSNWFAFYLQEVSQTFNYHGWFNKLNGIAIDLQFTGGADEDLETSFLLNTSPSFEFAAYTVAALTNTQPTVVIQGESIDIQAATLAFNGVTVLDKVVIGFGASSKATTKHSGSATTKKNGGASDPALQTLVDKMWSVDQDRPTAAQVKMNWGEHMNGKTGTKQADLFTSVDESLFTKKQYADLITTYDQQLFTADVCKAEPAMSGFRKSYIQAVFDTFTATPMFAAAFEYLKSVNYKETSTLANFKTKVLWPLWFGTYSRCKGPLGSSGWEHVFSGEIKSNEVDGQHDWVRYYKEQKADHMVYDGYYTHDDNLIGTFQYKWNGALKPTGGFFTGTSPAFDFSILTVCALAHGNGGNCHFKITNFPITVTSYLQACGDGSGTCLATAYPG
ncbi:hypothetical protein CAEBREN_21914 [Caenorhabditis brenneri]|uniref:EndoU domain-containing protein n=1 Tax=Caenorhabditis brenneri TaxID=135651 RepID=G0NJ92_CAEBE|nr:hypothetical protein CAEBREN_21914 [Caenorhabditis brenneri]